MPGANGPTRTGHEVKDGAWYYAEPKEKAQHIKDHVAFCKFFSVDREVQPIAKPKIVKKRKGGGLMEGGHLMGRIEEALTAYR